MAKCILCNKKIKFARKCMALNEVICSTCCGSKKGIEINCADKCEYFTEGQIKENKKRIMELVKRSFNKQEEDIYQNSEMLKLVGPFEEFIFLNYYNDSNATDDFFTDCFIKIYYSLDKKENIYNYNEIEMVIVNKFNELVKQTKMPMESQKTILLRLLKSVDNMSGGIYGNRMYLELLRNQFTGTGIVADVAGKI